MLIGKQTRHFGNLREEGKITHKGILKVRRGREVDSSGSGGSPVPEYCENGNEFGFNTKRIIS
jgi:hypothetical protein